MKGTTLARYLLIVDMTIGGVTVCAALPQQSDSQGVGYHPESSSIDSPTAKQPTGGLPEQPSKKSRLRSDLGDTVTHVFEDQKPIWLSPLNVRLSDAEWLAPLTGITTGAILTDASLSKALPGSAHRLSTYNSIRNAGVGALGAASGGLYLWSLRTHDPHQRETGILATEAIIDSVIVAQSISLVTSRERPRQGNGQGNFFQGGSSFPSSHSAAAWAAAGVLAHEYHGSLPKLLAYGLASTVSITSVGSRQHFPSDVLIGSGLGWMVSEYVYRKRHNTELGGSAWNPLADLIRNRESGPAKYPGSTYVPLDSWVYRAFDRLAALGLVRQGYEDTRPWSREECAHLLLEADQELSNPSAGILHTNSEVTALVQDLHHEFAREEATFTGPNSSLAVESVYSRVLSASGTALNDGYHLGQTIAYDFGRPFRQGTNFIAGGSASATYENLFFYIGGEYQHSASAPALSLPVREFIADRDKVSVPASAPFSAINRFELLDAYAGINFRGWQFTFGNQSLSWGPGIGGSLLLSDNAAPFPMLRISPEHPTLIPGLSNVLGPFHVEQFYGRLEGHQGRSQPWIYGQKISFKPFRSLEFAYSRTTLIGGFNDPLTSYPLTSKQFFFSLFGRVDPGQNSVPGDSRTAIDWTWRLPGMHDRATFYGELEDDDDLIPLQNLSKSVLRPGFYFPRLPFLPKWDLHVEWTSSTSPGRASFQSHGDLNYWNLEYTDGYTNNGNLMGNTVGREGVTLQAWIRYWASPRHTVDFSWKQSRVLSDFVPGGGKWQDYQASYSVTRLSGVYLRALLQFEHISYFPLLFQGSRNNVVASIELGFLPQWGHGGGRGSAVSGNAHENPAFGSQLP
jgi:Capsule assembly protein Wzi/PAP2 superfamily